jgi:hypothetical protein
VKVSAGFVAALIGVGMTIFSWFGPWAWPAWPAFTVLQIVFTSGSYAELPPVARSSVLVMLIAINVTFWGAIAYGLIRGSQRLSRTS